MKSDRVKFKEYLKVALSAASEAGKAIMEIYATDFDVQHKNDESPVTLADKTAHDIICERLKPLGYPVVSEEGIEKAPVFDGLASTFWLVDPLDGTKEFISKNGEFTVNIALIQNERPVLGVVSAPALSVMYYAISGQSAFKVEENEVKQIYSSEVSELKDATIAVSRSHLKPEDKAFIERAGITSVKPVGSALKYCYLAEGKVDLSVRYTPLMQWDLAASDVIVHEAGGRVSTFSRRVYNYGGPLNSPLLGGVFVGNKKIGVSSSVGF